MRTFALIPVKAPAHAKTRLSSYLSGEERAGLVRAMLRDVLRAIEGLVEPVFIGAEEFNIDGVSFVREEGRGLTRAVEKGRNFAVEQGAHATLFVPADTPLIGREHVRDILKLGKRYRLVASPARNGGVSLIYKRPPDILNERFSARSFQDILSLAEQKGVEYHIYDSFYLSLDLDTGEDIREFFYHGRGTHAYSYLEKFGYRFMH